MRPVKFTIDAATPQAQKLSDVISEHSRIRSSSASSLELIPENKEGEDDDEYAAEEEEFDMPGIMMKRY